MQFKRVLSTHAACSAGGVDEGSITFELCTRFVDEWVVVSEPEIARGMLSVLEQAGERIEGAPNRDLVDAVEDCCRLARTWIF